MALHIIMRLVLFLVSTLGFAQGDNYSSFSGMMKTTYASSNPQAVGAWLTQNLVLPLALDPRGRYGNYSEACGALYRPVLCADRYCMHDGGNGGTGFGIHMILAKRGRNDAAAKSIAEVENIFDLKLFGTDCYDAFHDFATAIYVHDLSPVVLKLRASNQNNAFLAVQWRDDAGSQWYSILVHVPLSQLVFELISHKAPVEVDEWRNDDLVRVPATVFERRNSTGSFNSGFPTVLAVSRATHNITASLEFYQSAFSASVTYSHSVHGVITAALEFPGVEIHVRFTQRSASNTSGSFSVQDLANYKNKVHDSFWVNITYGFDWFLDNHIAFSVPQSFSATSQNLDKTGSKYRVWGWDIGGPIYGWEPTTGEGYQLVPNDYRQAMPSSWSWQKDAPDFVERHGLPCGCPIDFCRQGECGPDKNSSVPLPPQCFASSTSTLLV